MEAYNRAETLLNTAREAALINPVTGDGAPTLEMIAEAIMDAEGDVRQDAFMEQRETLGLLKEILLVLEERTTGHTVIYSDRIRPFIPRIREHLAKAKRAGEEGED